eukprot:scaffold3456_cov112-Cylindrotheca_fusiformis.AAC.2
MAHEGSHLMKDESTLVGSYTRAEEIYIIFWNKIPGKLLEYKALEKYFFRLRSKEENWESTKGISSLLFLGGEGQICDTTFLASCKPLLVSVAYDNNDGFEVSAWMVMGNTDRQTHVLRDPIIDDVSVARPSILNRSSHINHLLDEVQKVYGYIARVNGNDQEADIGCSKQKWLHQQVRQKEYLY